LKFTKDGGIIKIVCTYVKPGKKRSTSNRYTGHDSYSTEKSSASDSDNSENSQFNREHKIDSLFDPDPVREKIVI
jgi:hypothetical protein